MLFSFSRISYVPSLLFQVARIPPPKGEWGIRLPLPLFGGRRASPDACYKRQDGCAGYPSDYPWLYNRFSAVRICGFYQCFRSNRHERVVKVVKEHLTVIVVVDVLGEVDDMLRQLL